MSSPRNDEQVNWRRIAKAGADIAGAATGAGIGQWLGGPVGAATGGAYGATVTLMFKDVVLDFANRMLGHREEERVGAVIRYFWDKYQENLAAGGEPRQDGFFSDTTDDRAAAKEIFEGVLLAAQGEHQEKKLRFFGNLVANIAFHPEIDRAQANHLIAVAENLSYRQLCALALFANKDRWGIRLRQELSDVNRSWSMAETSLYHEIFGLYSSHLIGPSNSGAILGLSEITPGRMEVWGVGIILYNLMELGSIESGEVADMVPLLQLP